MLRFDTKIELQNRLKTRFITDSYEKRAQKAQKAAICRTFEMSSLCAVVKNTKKSKIRFITDSYEKNGQKTSKTSKNLKKRQKAPFFWKTQNIFLKVKMSSLSSIEQA